MNQQDTSTQFIKGNSGDFNLNVNDLTRVNNSQDMAYPVSGDQLRMTSEYPTLNP